MSNSALIYPESPDEYFTYGWYVSPTGYGWKFGLPATPSSTSNTCGAMPFRSGSELCSPNCLRGEDWVYMGEWASDRYKFPNPNAIEPAMYLTGYSGVVSASPSRSQLTGMYHNLTELKTVYGQDFDLEDQEVQYNDIPNVLLAALDRNYSLTSQQPPSSGTIPLERSRIQNFFTDMAKMKCTYGYASHDSSGSHMSKRLYDWSKDDGMDPPPPAEENEYFIESMRISSVGYYNNTRPIEFDAQFIGQFYAHEVIRNSYGQATTNKDGYALIKLGSKTTITQDLNAREQGGFEFSIPCHYGGRSLAGDVAGLLGMEINPSPPEHGDSWFYMELDYLYVVVWPKYLQL